MQTMAKWNHSEVPTCSVPCDRYSPPEAPTEVRSAETQGHTPENTSPAPAPTGPTASGPSTEHYLCLASSSGDLMTGSLCDLGVGRGSEAGIKPTGHEVRLFCLQHKRSRKCAAPMQRPRGVIPDE